MFPLVINPITTHGLQGLFAHDITLGIRPWTSTWHTAALLDGLVEGDCIISSGDSFTSNLVGFTVFIYTAPNFTFAVFIRVAALSRVIGDPDQVLSAIDPDWVALTVGHAEVDVRVVASRGKTIGVWFCVQSSRMLPHLLAYLSDDGYKDPLYRPMF